MCDTLLHFTPGRHQEMDRVGGRVDGEGRGKLCVATYPGSFFGVLEASELRRWVVCCIRRYLPTYLGSFPLFLRVYVVIPPVLLPYMDCFGCLVFLDELRFVAGLSIDSRNSTPL